MSINAMEIPQANSGISSKSDWRTRVLSATQLILSSVVTCAFLVGCSSIGPSRLADSHEGYNDAVQQTVTREVLKNIVRKRYSDPIQFITVGSINAQFSVNVGANLGVSGGSGTATSGQAGGNLGYSESPTITFIPQSDAGFNKSLDSPIELQEAISYVYHWGNFVEHDLGLVFGAINNAMDRQGTSGDAYRSATQALTRLVNKGATLRHFREFYPRHAPIKKEQVNGLAYVLAAQSNLYLTDAGNGKFEIASKHMGIGLAVPLPHTGETLTDLRTLELTPGQALYPIRGTGEAEPSTILSQSNTIWVAPRSVEGMFELAAMHVEVPKQHEVSGIALSASQITKSNVSLPLRIRHSLEKPLSVYRIKHRGYWFYIDDSDLESKRLFATLVASYTSRIGSKTASDNAPQIVLPVGGR